MEKITNTIFIILTAIILLASTIMPQEGHYYYKYIQIAGYAITIAYFLIRLIQKKPIKIIKNKLDIFVILLTISTAIPIIFNKYITFYGAVAVTLQYTYALSIYFLIREITYGKKGLGKIITNVLILAVIISILIGLDGITFNNTKNFLEILKIELSENGDNRVVSTFGCATALAVCIASVLFLNINECLTQKKTAIKALYKTITLIFIIGIVLTYSKGVFVVLSIIMALYILLLKDKTKRLELIENLLISGILTIMFLMSFDKLFNQSAYLSIWIIFGFVIFSSYFINLIFEKINTYIEKINIKKVLIICIVIIAIASIYIIIGLNVFTEYIVFNKYITSDYKVKIINNVKGNTNYKLEFDIEAETSENIEKMYTIKVIEKDVRNDEIESHQIDFSDYKGIQTFEITTQEETTEFRIEFYMNKLDKEYSLVINSLNINNEIYPLQYKYLPTKLIEKVKSISINYKTLQERKEMVLNALELSKDNFILGIGGDGWMYEYKYVQSYDYTARKIHSYPAKVMLEFGLLGVIAYLGIMIIPAIRIIKEDNKDILAVLFALILLMVHTILDTDMEYIHLLMYAFGLMGVISANLKNKEKINIISIIFNIVLIGIMLTSIYLKVNIKKYDMYANISELLRQRNGLRVTSDEYKDINKKIAQQYEYILSKEHHSYMKLYNNILEYYMKSNEPDLVGVLEKYYEKIKEYKEKDTKNPETIIYKFQVVNNIIKRLESTRDGKYYNLTKKYAEIILDEYDETKAKLEECRKNLDDSKYISTLTDAERIYEYALEINSNYLEGVRIYNQDKININKEKLANINIELSNKLLIYHTHGTESFKTEEPYETYEFYRSTDSNYNVIRLGNYLTELLESNGFEVIHDTEYYDLPSIDGAYTRSETKAKKILAQNEDINFVIDLHRDAISEIEHIANTIEINGEKVSNLRFVVGANLENDEWLYDLKLAIELQKIADEKYPGLFKSIIIRDTDYNQGIAKHALLIEVGENCNMIDEVLRATEYFAEIITNIN